MQCVDSISGCSNALYDLGLLQSTGTIYDEFLFGPGNNPVIRKEQDSFMAGIRATPPRVFIVTDSLFPTGPDGYKKLQLWPAFADYLSSRYRLASQGEFPSGETGRLGYRIYSAIVHP